jgi:hypothetical protein
MVRFDEHMGYRWAKHRLERHSLVADINIVHYLVNRALCIHTHTRNADHVVYKVLSGSHPSLMCGRRGTRDTSSEVIVRPRACCTIRCRNHQLLQLE